MELLLDKNKSIDIAIKIAKELNQKNLFIPVLDGFEVKENLRNGFVASNSHGIIEKYVFEDGTFDDINTKIKDTLHKATDYGNQRGALLKPENIFFVGKYSLDFEFHIYIQDILLNNHKFIREMNAYFLNTDGKTFHQVSVSSGPYSVREGQKLLKDFATIGFQRDSIVNVLSGMLLEIIQNIKK